MDVQQFIRHAIDGNAVLFTGAGFSFGATNRVDEKIPSGIGLASMLLDSVGYGGRELPLDRAAAAYLRRKDEAELVNLLGDQFTPANVTPDHQVLASLPWRRVYTTNYDTVYEKARRGAKLKATSLDAVDDPREHLHKGNVIVHINGSIDRLSVSRLGNSFKLTTASYATDAFMDSPWAFHFRSDIRAAKAIIFVGYSMYDIDIRRILFEEDVSDRCLFITAPITADNELEAEDLSDLGLLAPIGLGAFATQVRGELARYQPLEEDLLLDAWNEVIGPSPAASRPSDNDVQNFLIYGIEAPSLLFEAGGPDAAKYCVPRLQAERICAELKSKASVVALHGGLGTGKTFIAKIVAGLLARSGVRVFWLDVASTLATSEAEKIVALPGEKVLIVDGYYRQLNMLRRLAELDRSVLRVLLVERTSTHELLRDEVVAASKLPMVEIDVDDLNRAEVDDSIRLLNTYGLWGIRQAWADHRKESFVRVDCESKLPHLLVSVLEAAHVSEKYIELLESNPNAAELRQIVICVAALTVLSHRVLVATVQELLGSKVILSRYRKYGELREIIDIGARQVTMKSPVLSLHLLQKVFKGAEVADVLTQMMVNASALRREDEEFRAISNDLMRYGSVSLILPEKQRLAATIKYYESIKELPGAARNPQFWLQYAIGCLANRQLDRAGRYFDDAYSLAERDPAYDTFQIDNHYARFLLQKAVTEQPISDSMVQIIRAKEIVVRQIRSEVRHYPYRVALSFFDVYDTLLPKMSPDSKKQVQGILSEIHGYAGRAGSSLRNNRYVLECLRRGDSLFGPIAGG